MSTLGWPNGVTMKPLKKYYLDEDELGDEYCNRTNCDRCFGTDINGEPNGYGCDGRENYIYSNQDEFVWNIDTAYFYELDVNKKLNNELLKAKEEIDRLRNFIAKEL